MSSNGFVDLRSDTVTVPTDEMRRAMAAADVGDDCYGEDPTVNRLQELAAEMLGCEAALFVPTGTMANQIAVKVLSEAGGEVICEEDCHLIHHESGASALLSQVQLRGLDGRLGVLEPDAVRTALRPDDPYQPRSVLVSIENTHNAAGGTMWSLEEVSAVADVARQAGLPVHCDGARLFNACVASGTKASAYASECDLVTISLYKGLSAPMGSLVCGSRDLVEEAWRYRRIFGGALRQAGVVAAAGVLALTTMVDRLADDHTAARRLAEGLAELAPAGAVPLERVQTNMVLFDAASCGLDAEAVRSALKAERVLAGLIGPGVLRFVTHKDVAGQDVGKAISAFGEALKALSGTMDS
jgi:threonine aldolase